MGVLNVNNSPNVGCDIDEVWEALTVMDVGHRSIHTGDLYASMITASVVNGTTANCLIRTPASAAGGGYVHMMAQLSVAGSCSATLYEQCTASVTGTTINPKNLNRNATRFMPFSAAVAATVSAAAFGTAIISKQCASAVPLNNWDVQEFILLPSTDYLLYIANGNAATETVVVGLRGYSKADGIKVG